MKTSPYSNHYVALRAWLKSKRVEREHTLRTISLKMGRHHSIFGKLERDSRRIDLIEYIQYCRALDIDPKEGLDVVMASLDSGMHKGSTEVIGEN